MTERATGPADRAAILIGGQGRRLGGQPKHQLVNPDGELVLKRLTTLLEATVGPVFLVSRDASWVASPPGVQRELVFDTLPGRGAAGGLHAALTHAAGASGDGRRPGWTFVCACDLPLLDAATIRTLARARASQGVVLARAGGHLQPLAAFWHTRALPVVEAALADGGASLKALVAALDAEIIDFEDPRPFANVNTPEDLAALGLRLTSSRSG